MAPDKFKKTLLISLGIALGIIVILTISLFSLNSDINKRLAVIQQYKDDLALRSQTVLLLSELRKEAQRADELSQTISTALPTRDQLITFPREIEQLAIKNKVEFGFGFGSETAGSSSEPGFVKFTMTLGGGLPDIVSFLKQLESSSYFISLGSVDISSRARGGYALTTGGQVYIQ
jgi:Tfp pilus assembly protein PilO